MYSSAEVSGSEVVVFHDGVLFGIDVIGDDTLSVVSVSDRIGLGGLGGGHGADGDVIMGSRAATR